MAGKSVYLQTRHKARGQLLSRHASPGCCLRCQLPKPHDQLFKQWCIECLANWGASADPLLIESARAAYAMSSTIAAVPEPPTVQAYERLKERIAERRPDEWFIPMTLFIGNYSIGQAQANWNFLQAMYELEIMTTAHAFKFGKESHDILHLCGRHAPMPASSLGSFIGRVIHSRVWHDVEPHMREYINDLLAENRALRIWSLPRTPISAIASNKSKPPRRAYRCDPNRKTLARKQAEREKLDRYYGGTVQPVPAFWPFAVRQAPTEHEMLHLIDRATRGIPEQWRQDVCQDLVVAVLSGETTLENLHDAIPDHIRRVFQMHPIKYGDASLDAPVWGFEGSRTLADVLAQVEQEDREERPATNAEPDRCGWHYGRNRPVGLADLGEIAES